MYRGVFRRFLSSQAKTVSEFSRAQSAVKGLQKDPGNDLKLALYGLFKQASEGDVSGNPPSMFDMVGKAKYSKWQSFQGMTKEDAQAQYVAIVKSLMPNGALPENMVTSVESGGSTEVSSNSDSGDDEMLLSKTPSLKDIAYPRSTAKSSIKTLSPLLKTMVVSVSDSGVLTVKMNRPDKGNSLNMQMWHELTQIFDLVNRDSDVKVVVLTGGDKTFSTGMDLSVFAEMNSMTEKERCPGRMREGLFTTIKYLQNAISGPENCKVPVIASIAGNCIGGAVDLITACDMRYSTEDAVFCIKETDLAMVADIGTTQRLPKLIGDSQARELCYTARNFDGKEAHEMGLVLKTFRSTEELDSHVGVIAETIASKSPLTLRGIKSTLLHTRDNSVEAGLDYVAMHNSSQLYSADLMEAMRATMAKETPKFTDP